MNVLVVDASVLVVALADDGPDGARARARLGHERLVAPEIIDLEVCSVLRRAVRTEQLPQGRAAIALGDLARLPMERASHSPLVHRCWELRDNVSPYDAAYVALAERAECILLTADLRLAQAPGPRCAIEVLV